MGNWSWLLYAVACRWFRSVAYVHHPAIDGDDIPRGLLGSHDPSLEGDPLDADFIWLRQLPAEMMTDFMSRAYDFKPVRDDAKIPFRAVRVDRYSADGPFRRVFLTRSPSYTPPAADELLDLIREYTDERTS